MVHQRFRNDRGNGGAGLIGLMLGFGVVYFICFCIVSWIYDTKEARSNGKKKHEELRVITKEEVMKRGIGQHTFQCSGIFSKTCKAVELYQPTA